MASELINIIVRSPPIISCICVQGAAVLLIGGGGHGWKRVGVGVGTNTSLVAGGVRGWTSWVSLWSHLPMSFGASCNQLIQWLFCYGLMAWYCWTEFVSYFIITFDLIYFQIFNIGCTNRCHVCNDTMAREQCIPLHICCICTNVESYKYVSQFPCFCKILYHIPPLFIFLYILNDKLWFFWRKCTLREKKLVLAKC